MAHECPDCGMTCHCGGDIDDLVFTDRKRANQCTCCDDPADDDEDDYIDDENDQ